MKIEPLTKQLIQQAIDLKTKPVAALGMLEQLALQIAQVQNSLTPILKSPSIVVFAGDHGIANEGVSAYPQEVTFQMVMNFLQGGAAINVFCKQNNLQLYIVDAGVNFDFSQEATKKLIYAKVGKGTHSFLHHSAMTVNQLQQCLDYGQNTADTVFKTGCNIVGFGEMGIGNTSSAALIMSYICRLPLQLCVGKGTGISDIQFKHKIEVLEKAKQYHGDLNDPKIILQSVGGFEIAQMCGAMLAAFEYNQLILVDGFIASSAFLVAYTINPDIIKNAIFCHLSDEYGHQNLLNYLKVEPLLKLGMRLGEGSGCAVAYPIIESAVTFLNNMASFKTAGVSTQY